MDGMDQGQEIPPGAGEGEVLFTGADITVTGFANANGDAPGATRCVVTFDYLKLPGEPSIPYGRKAIRDAGAAQVHLATSWNHWFQTEDTPAAILAAQRFCAGRPTFLFGASMGGFAAIQFAPMFNTAAVIAIAPQFSADPRKVPFEDRWQGDIARLDFRHDSIAETRSDAPVHVLYDPFCRQDAAHVRMIERHRRVVHLRCPFADHHPDRMLASMGQFSTTLRSIIEGWFSVTNFARWRREARAQNTLYDEGMRGALAVRATSGLYWG